MAKLTQLTNRISRNSPPVAANLSGTDLLKENAVQEMSDAMNELWGTLHACARLLNYHAEHMNSSKPISNNLPFGIADVLDREAGRISRLQCKAMYGHDVKAG